MMIDMLWSLSLHGARHTGRPGLDRMRRAPGPVAASEGGDVEAALPQVPRHTGARRFVGSGTVRDHRTRALGCAGPRPDLIRQHADTAGNLTVVGLVLRAPGHIQYYRRIPA